MSCAEATRPRRCGPAACAMCCPPTPRISTRRCPRSADNCAAAWPSTRWAGVDRARSWRRWATVGGAGLRRAGDGPVTLNPGTMIFKGATVRGFWLSDWLMSRSFPQQLLMARSVLKSLRGGFAQSRVAGVFDLAGGGGAGRLHLRDERGKGPDSPRRKRRWVGSRAAPGGRRDRARHPDQRRGDPPAADRDRRRWSWNDCATAVTRRTRRTRRSVA
jgi:hypothetical protein